MNRRLGLAGLAVLALVALSAPHANGADAEDGFISVLQSDKPPVEKAAACRSLKTAGTGKSVPALAALLPDKVLAHWARVALETMPCPEAGAALRDALPKAAGVTKAGICDSLGARREAEAVPALAELAKDADEQIASSAAVALGKIGNAAAVEAIKAAKAKAPAGAQLAFCDGLLLAADQLRAAGDKKAAAALCKELYESDAPEHVKAGAFRGLVLASDDPLPLMTKALAGADKAAWRAALPLVREIKGEAATKEFAAVLATAPAAPQVALIGSLRQRGDPAAGPAIVALLESKEQPVRVAALEAVAALGDATIAPALAAAAAKASGAEQDTARECLNQLRDPKTRDALLAALPKAPPAAQVEMLRALGFRKETQAVGPLLKMAEEGDEATRLVAAKSLGMLAPCQAAADVVRLLLAAKTDAEREALEQALAAVCGRAAQPEELVPAVVSAMKAAGTPQRVALLRVAGRLGGAASLEALRAGIQDKEPAIQDAALRTMAESGGFDAAPDLLKLAKEAPSLPHKVLALRGCWRLVASSGRPLDERWKLCGQTFAAAQRPEDRKLGLSELANLPHAGALKLALSLCDDEAVRDEAERACVQIAVGLGGSQPAEAKAALQKLAAASKNETLRAEAKKALDAMDQYTGYITAWLASGPYRQDGKQCAELFDIVFAPEKEDAKDVKWQPAPRPADAALFWQADLLPICGGDQCVVYVKTRVFSPKEQKVQLEIGSDDGNKVWVNGKLVHAKNVQRGIKAGDDKADATLKEGWNDFLVKVTQNVMGCAVCVRIRGLDGSVVEGLRFDAAGTGGAK